MTTTRPRASARLAARFGKLSRLALLSTTVTAAVVAVGVSGLPSDDTVAADATRPGDSLSAAGRTVDAEQLAERREPALSRSAPRVTLKPKVEAHKFATAPLNIWTAPHEQGANKGLLSWGTKIGVTGQVVGHWAEVLLPDHSTKVKTDKVVRWVNADYLADTKPKREKPVPESTDGEPTSTSTTPTAPTTTGLSSAPCPDGSGTESGLTSSAVRLYRAVCAAFPALVSYGGYDAHGEHASGRAIDFMTSDSTLGTAIATFVQAHAAELGIYDVIWQQRIWTPERAAEGWRYMPSRGSATADHYDHVHVAVY